MVLESSFQGLQLWFRPRPDPRSGRGAMKSQSPGTPTGTVSGQLRDSISGVPRKSDIQMPLPRVNAKYTIGSKVVAYSRVRAVVSLVCPSAWSDLGSSLTWCPFLRCFVPHPSFWKFGIGSISNACIVSI